MHKETVTLIHAQINREFFSAYLYLDIANYYAGENLAGFGNWFKAQAQEEQDHAMRFIHYLQDNDEKIILSELKAPAGKYNDVKTPLEMALAHEKAITQSIHQLYDQAMQQKDFRTMQFLNWFIGEQNEEEKIMKDICDKFSLLHGDKHCLCIMDAELKSRIYAPVSAPQ